MDEREDKSSLFICSMLSIGAAACVFAWTTAAFAVHKPTSAEDVDVRLRLKPGSGAGKAAIAGDFVLTSDEVDPVIKALRASDIEITAIHSRMLDEQPRLIFLHFWTMTTDRNLHGVFAMRATRLHARRVGIDATGHSGNRVFLACCADAAERHQRLGGAHIHATRRTACVPRDVFEHNGRLISYAMGKRTVGKSRSQRDELCLTPCKVK